VADFLTRLSGVCWVNLKVSKERAEELGVFDIAIDPESGKQFVYLESSSGPDGGFRESIRLEGKRRFDRGLFLLDVEYMPSG